MNRLIQWFVENRVAANLLMVLIFVGCFFSFANLSKEVFPVVARNFIEVQMNYPGAGPAEVEQQLAIRIEESIADLEGIYAISSKSRQGYVVVSIEVAKGYDPQQILGDVKTRVDAINTFPGNVERPVVRRQMGRSQLMSIALYGDVDEAALKETGMRIRNELALLPGISQVQLNGTRPYEMGVEISEENLRRYHLTFDQIAQAIRQSSLDLPAGTIRTRDGDIQIQTRSQADSADEFGRIPIITRADGSKLLLRDIADINDGFSDWTLVAQYNGQRAVFLELSISEDPDILAAARDVNAYIDTIKPILPAGIDIDIWRDMSKLFDARLNLLVSNAFGGLILVFVVLMLFLRPLIAIWVCVGIATAFAGAIWMLPYLGVSINMVSLFAFLLVLGIVVDDAIIVGESIYSRQQHGLKGSASAASGAKLVSAPVFFSVASTMIFFMPMLDVPGSMGPVAAPIAIVVILCLFFSLVESLLILPSHLANMKAEVEPRSVPLKKLSALRQKVAAGLDYFASAIYQPFLIKLLRNKGATILGFVMAFALSLTLFSTGWLKSSFMPQVPGDSVEARLTLP
jgi:multidrug efflux pump subunit AcrB